VGRKKEKIGLLLDEKAGATVITIWRCRGYGMGVLFLMEVYMKPATIKTDAMKLVKKLPRKPTWENLMHEVYVREAVEAGIADSRAGRVKDVYKARKLFGLD